MCGGAWGTRWAQPMGHTSGNAGLGFCTQAHASLTQANSPPAFQRGRYFPRRTFRVPQNEFSSKEEVDVLEGKHFLRIENTLEKYPRFLQDPGIKQKIETRDKVLFSLLRGLHLLNLPVPENAVEVTFFLSSCQPAV